MVLGLKPGETNYLDVKKTRFWTEPRHCIVLGLKPGETNYLDVKKTRFWTTSWMCNQLFKKKKWHVNLKIQLGRTPRSQMG